MPFATAVTLMVILLCACSTAAEPGKLLLGVDTAGSEWLTRSDCELATDKALAGAIRELGANFMVYHLVPGADASPQGMRRRVAAIDSAMRSLGLRYTLNNETSNWIESLEFEPGVNELQHPDGCHRWDVRMDWLEQTLAGPDPALVGVTYDECEHMQLTSHQFGTRPDGTPLDVPLLANTDGKSMETAFNLLVSAAKKVRERSYQGKVMLCTEQVWPDLFHIFANAGWTITPKILKENLSSVVLSISLGAALEYSGGPTQWWVSPDLWGREWYPGHSPQALRSALLMGYWLGADALYVENLDFQEWPSRHPSAPPKGSLLLWKNDGSYELTPYGDVVRDFYTRYIPSHPRTIDWRDYSPKVAIVRLPDGAWGQKGTIFRDRLLGNKDHPTDEISSEWLHIWPILTHGAARDGAISLNNGEVYPEQPWPFFVPIDSVAVFDHLVSGKVLDSVECFIVCGHALSERTFRDISRRVREGATCIIARRLYEAHAGPAAPGARGKWVVVDSFTDPIIARTLKPFLGPPNVARFRFLDRTVEFRPAGDRDTVNVRVIENRAVPANSP